MSDQEKPGDKNPHAVALGSRGGKIGGQVRARRLSSSRRSEIASQAATARWKAQGGIAKPARAKPTTDAEGTRQRILAAAHREFTEVGLAGARVDRIAESAGVNKRMLYHYFESKEGLFREMLRRNLLELTEADMNAPPNLGDDLIYWRDLFRVNPDWIRLSLWEALTCKPKDIIGEQERRIFWQKAVGQIEQQQTEGKLTAELDGDMLQLYLFALTAFPLILPQMTRLMTGLFPTEPEFLERQNSFLRAFSKLLGSGSER